MLFPTIIFHLWHFMQNQIRQKFSVLSITNNVHVFPYHYFRIIIIFFIAEFLRIHKTQVAIWKQCRQKSVRIRNYDNVQFYRYIVFIVYLKIKFKLMWLNSMHLKCLSLFSKRIYDCSYVTKLHHLKLIFRSLNSKNISNIYPEKNNSRKGRNVTFLFCPRITVCF